MTLSLTRPLILASSSDIRARLLTDAGLNFSVEPGRIDEQAVQAAHRAEGGTAYDLADLLAELKALKISDRRPTAMVIGADQVLDCDGRLLAKPETPDQARDQLAFLSGRTHRLLSAAVVAEGGRPLWRHVGQVRMTMHRLTPVEIDNYVTEYWDEIRHSVGCYRIEAEGVRLFSRIEGDFFHILGLPLIELLTWLRIRGDIVA